MQTAFTLLDAPSIGRVVLVREMTVAEIRALMRLESESNLGVILLLTDITPRELATLDAPDMDRLLEQGFEINRAFFGEEWKESQAPEAANDAPNNLADLERAVARIIRCGHPNAWDYPWAVFDAAVEELAREGAK
jgi:hypothetical protein